MLWKIKEQKLVNLVLSVKLLPLLIHATIMTYVASSTNFDGDQKTAMVDAPHLAPLPQAEKGDGMLRGLIFLFRSFACTMKIRKNYDKY